LKLECSHCHYVWDYRGENRFYATCPQCRYKVKVPQGSAEKARPAQATLTKEPVKLRGTAAIVGRFLDRHGHDKEALIQVLLGIQGSVGWLPQEMITEVSRQMEVPYSQVYQVATFYKAFSLAPRGKHLIKVCNGTSCNVRGAQKVIEGLERKLGIGRDETTLDGRFSLETVNCIGCCAMGPMITIDDEYFGKMTPANLDGILGRFR